MKKITFALLVVASLSLQADESTSSKFGKILKPSDVPNKDQICIGLEDDICNMELVTAIAYCESIGGRLPTARDMANYAIGFGAQGIIETSFPNVSVRDPRVHAEKIKVQADTLSYPVYTYNELNEATVAFYYSAIGYNSAVKETESATYRPGGMTVWTSSVLPASVTRYPQFDGQYTFNSGHLNWDYSHFRALPVMCFKSEDQI